MNTYKYIWMNLKVVAQMCEKNTGWRRFIGSPKLQIVFYKRAVWCSVARTVYLNTMVLCVALSRVLLQWGAVSHELWICILWRIVVQCLTNDVSSIMAQVCQKDPTFMWMNHVSSEWVIWMRHVPYEWVMSHVNESCLIRKGDMNASCVIDVSRVACEWVVSHMDESWFMSHIAESCYIWLTYALTHPHVNDSWQTYESVILHVSVSDVTHDDESCPI